MLTIARFVEQNALWPFVLWPAGVLAARFKMGAKLPYWAVAILLFFGSWLLFIGATELERASLLWQLEHSPQPPPQQMVDRYVNDTGLILLDVLAPLYALLYSGLWCLPFTIVQLVRRALKKT
jgi:hypothetical protein